MIPFSNTYARLPERFHARLPPTPVARPRLVRVNRDLALSLGIDPDWLAGPEGLATLSGNHVPDGAEPLALAYAGHQFGGFVPQLGDGRALLLGEVVGTDGERYDLQLKGSGPTSFSRRGDGRAALGPVLREYLLSEAMAALGIPTTRALAAVTTGETVYREDPLPGAVLARVAGSHIRVGTFQYFAARRDTDGLRILADYAIARHYTEAAGSAQPYRAFLDGVVARHAALVAQWLLVGFVHGVMNTDNTSISGETIDYGPCAFLEAYDPNAVFSSIDRHGRYAYGNQPNMALWNLARLGEALMPILDTDEDAALRSVQESLEAFAPIFHERYHAGLLRKLGIAAARPGDVDLAQDLLARMAANRADYTLTFRRLADAAAGPEGDAAVAGQFADASAYAGWAGRWRDRLAGEPDGARGAADAMATANPAYIPRNHKVEAALDAATTHDNLGPFESLLDAVTHPFAHRPDLAQYAVPATAEQRVHETFCGT